MAKTRFVEILPHTETFRGIMDVLFRNDSGLLRFADTMVLVAYPALLYANSKYANNGILAYVTAFEITYIYP